MIWILVVICCTSFAPRVLSQSSSDPGEGKGPPYVVHAQAGADVILNCDAASSVKTFDLIEWRKNGSKSPIFIKFMSFKPHVDKRYSRRLHMVNRTAILIAGVKDSDAGIYRCKTMYSGSTSTVFGQGTPVVLKVKVLVPPFFKTRPRAKISTIEGRPLTLECIVGGFPEPEVMWFRNDEELPYERLSIIRGSWLTLNRAEHEDSGLYQCVVKNEAGFLRHEFSVFVERDASAVPSRRKSVTEGYPAVLDCLTDTSLPSSGNIMFSWSRDGINIKDNPRLTVLASGALFVRSSLRSDSGVYTCTANTFDSSGLVTYPGAKILLDVQFPPVIISITDVVAAPESSDARLPCVSKGNPATLRTNWTLDGHNLLVSKRFVVLERGTLLIRNVKRSDVGLYKCTPINSVGAGVPKVTKLVVKVLPTFTNVPRAVMTVRIGDTVRLKCAAVSEMVPTVYWEREGAPFPAKRTLTSGGNLTIVDVKKGDHGVYKCIASTANGKAAHATTIAVMSTPGRPTITNIKIDIQSKYRVKRSSAASAVVSWRPGYDGGFPQKFEVWHRALSQSDYQWEHSKLLSADVTSYRVTNLLAGEVYMFSVRGVNKEGVGPFSRRKKAGPGVPSGSALLPDEKDKPLAPIDVTVNITTSGYYIYWRYDAVPGRPEVESFKVQYRKVNMSGNWVTAASALPGYQRIYLLKAEVIDEGTQYDFRVFAFAGNSFSNAAYVSKRFLIATPFLGKRAGVDEALPIIAGVIGAIAALVLIGLVCLCLIQWNTKKRQTGKKGKKVHFTLPDGTTEPYGDQDFDDEFCDPEIKLRPETVRFIPDDSEESEEEKLLRRQKNKPEDLITLTSYDSRPYGGQMLRYQVMVSETPCNEPIGDSPAESPIEDKVVFFGDYESKDGYSAWYDCSLTRPASREVRDSYDQFCRSPTEVGSRDSMDALPHRKRALYEQQGSKMMLVKKFDSNASLQGKREGSANSFHGSKFKTITEEGSSDEDALRGNGNLKRSRKLPSHHWSTPAVFMVQDSNNNKDSDTDSVDSQRRSRRSRRLRPHSMYSSITDQRPQLLEVGPKLQCICEHDTVEEKLPVEKAPKRSHKVKRVESDNSDRDTSYLHLEKRNSFLDQLKTWDNDSDQGPKGRSPYDSHDRRNESESDSDHSISPSHSLVSLSDSESDRELAKNFHGADNIPGNRLSFVGEADQTHLFRTASFLKGVDSESASDGNSSDGHEKSDGKPSSPNVCQDIKPQTAVKADLRNIGQPDSADELKVCDPFFRPPHKVSRSPSNASSGVSSLQVSSSETNSVDSYSPCESRRSTRFSGGSSYSSGYGSSRSSYESQGIPPIKLSDRRSRGDNPQRSGRHSFPKLVEPYEWDASELEDVDTEGVAYNPKRYEELMALQKQLGVELDSGGSNEELRNDADLKKLTTSDLLKMQPKISPPRYKVDLLSDDEKDKRCSKLLAEYKTNKRAPARKSPQTTVYRTWHL